MAGQPVAARLGQELMRKVGSKLVEIEPGEGEGLMNKNYVMLPRYTIALVKEKNLQGDYKTITESAQAAVVIRKLLLDQDREHFVVMCMDGKNTIIGISTVSIGSLTMAIVHPREVFKPAILMSAAGIIMAHNHPSGDPTPSPEDNELTRRLVKGSKLLGITILDHVIVGDKACYYSYADTGTLRD